MTPARSIAVFRVGAEQVMKDVSDETETQDAQSAAADVVDAYIAKLVKDGIETLTSTAKRELRKELNLCPPVFGRSFDF